MSGLDAVRQALRDVIADLEAEIAAVHSALAALNGDTKPAAQILVTIDPPPPPRYVTTRRVPGIKPGEATCPLCGRTFANAHGLQVHHARSHKPIPVGGLADTLLAKEARASIALDGQTQSLEPVGFTSKNPRNVLQCESCDFHTYELYAKAINKHTFAEHNRMSRPTERRPRVLS